MSGFWCQTKLTLVKMNGLGEHVQSLASMLSSTVSQLHVLLDVARPISTGKPPDTVVCTKTLHDTLKNTSQHEIVCGQKIR